MNLVTDLSKHSHHLFFRARGRRRILETPVQTFFRIGKQRAGLARCIAHGNHEVKFLIQIFIHGFLPMAGNIHPDFCNRLNSPRIHPAEVRAGAEHFETVAREVSQKSFGHLAAAGVAGAEEEDCLFWGSQVRYQLSTFQNLRG